MPGDTNTRLGRRLKPRLHLLKGVNVRFQEHDIVLTYVLHCHCELLILDQSVSIAVDVMHVKELLRDLLLSTTFQFEPRR